MTGNPHAPHRVAGAGPKGSPGGRETGVSRVRSNPGHPLGRARLPPSRAERRTLIGERGSAGASPSHAISWRGVTLFEVLLALAIFVGSMAALGQLISTGVAAALRAKHEAEAILRAESKLAEVVAGVELFQPVSSVAFPDHPRWHWSLAVRPTPHLGLVALDLSVWFENQRGGPSGRYTVTRLQRTPQVYTEALALQRTFEAEQATEAQQTTTEQE